MSHLFLLYAKSNKINTLLKHKAKSKNNYKMNDLTNARKIHGVAYGIKTLIMVNVFKNIDH